MLNGLRALRTLTEYNIQTHVKDKAVQQVNAVGHFAQHTRGRQTKKAK